MIVDAAGIPLAITLTGGNRNDVTQLLPLLDGVGPVRGTTGRPRQRADQLLADRGYDHDKYRRELWRPTPSAPRAPRACTSTTSPSRRRATPTTTRSGTTRRRRSARRPPRPGTTRCSSSRFAQSTRGLRPVAVESSDPAVTALKAWRLEGRGGARRLVILNKQDRDVTTTVAAPGSGYVIDRLTPYDPTGAGRTLDAADVRIDGVAVAADGSWPGFAPQAGAIRGGRFELTVAAGEAVVLSFHGRA